MNLIDGLEDLIKKWECNVQAWNDIDYGRGQGLLTAADELRDVIAKALDTDSQT